MHLIDKYFKIQKEAHEHFGYREGWRVIPMDDARDYFWSLTETSVKFAEKEDTLLSEDGNHYENEIYMQRFLQKWVYDAGDYTMICVDTRTDENKFLQIFDNSKRLPKKDD